MLLGTDMTTRTRNSMAAILSIIMTVIIWAVIILGAFAFIVLSIGLSASLNEGSLSLPVGKAASDISHQTFVFSLLSLGVIVPGVVYVCIQLRRILTTLADGDPFVPENAPRLTRIAVALAAMEIASIIFVLCMRVFVPESDAELRPPLSINPVVWAGVAALLVLAQVFREGTRLREEEKMTI